MGLATSTQALCVPFSSRNLEAVLDFCLTVITDSLCHLISHKLNF